MIVPKQQPTQKNSADIDDLIAVTVNGFRKRSGWKQTACSANQARIFLAPNPPKIFRIHAGVQNIQTSDTLGAHRKVPVSLTKNLSDRYNKATALPLSKHPLPPATPVSKTTLLLRMILLSPSTNKVTAPTNQSENLQVIPTGKENRTSSPGTPDLNKTEEASPTDSDQQNDTPTPDSLYPFRKIESISPLDIKRKDLSEAQSTQQEADFLPERKWKTQLFNWKPSDNHHFPLYFDDMPLERYGHHLGLLQPFWSAGQFVTQALLIPYTTGLEAPLKKRYALGYARPGDPVPRLWYQIPFSMRSAASGAAALSTNIMGIP